jgi:lysophospholipase L1-like esterase
MRNRGILSESLLATQIEIPRDGSAGLGHLIRLSANPRIIYELKPELSVLYRNRMLTTNSAGFRSPELPTAKATGAVRIVGIGDSYMFGLGVGDDENYLAVLGELLNEFHQEPQFEVVNGAVPGYNTVMEVATLEEKGLAYRPDIVIIEFVGNDLNLPDFIRSPSPVFSLRTVFLGGLISDLLSRDESSLIDQLAEHGLTAAPRNQKNRKQFARQPEFVPPAYRDIVGWNAFAGTMIDLKRLEIEHPFDVVAISLTPYPSRLHRRVMRLWAEQGFRILDVGASFGSYLVEHGYESYLGSPLAISRTNGHPSTLGHRLAAETILDFLQSEFGDDWGVVADNS